MFGSWAVIGIFGLRRQFLLHRTNPNFRLSQGKVKGFGKKYIAAQQNQAKVLFKQALGLDGGKKRARKRAPGTAVAARLGAPRSRQLTLSPRSLK
jgi:hypothetical protein